MTAKTKIEKVKAQFKPVNFEELKYTLPPLLYDATKEQTIPLTINAFTPQGFRSGYAAHRLKPMTDARFFQQESEFEAFKKQNFAPTKQLWLDLIIERIGYKENPNWQSLVTDDDIIRVFAISRKFELEIDQAETEEAEFDDSGETCLRFRVFYGGLTTDDWREWLTTGELPENIILDEASYNAVLALIKKGIAPSAELLISFYFQKTSYADSMKFLEIQNGEAKNPMAVASRDRRTKAEQLVDFYDDLPITADGYAGDIPAIHKGYVLQNYFAVKVAILGKS